MARKQAKPAENGDGVATAEPEPEIVWKGNELLRPFLVPIRNLREDDRNANTHSDRSIDAIAGSYLRFGQAKPLVTAADGTVKDGNGQLIAAAGLGWTHIAVIPSDLEGHELAAYALAVNRSSDLSEWNFEELARQLKELEGYGAETADLGWDPDELELLLKTDRQPGTHAVSFEARNGQVVENPEDEWQGMPEFEHEDQTAKFKVYVHIRNEDDLKSFEELVGQKVPRDRWAIWHPAVEIGHYKDKRYATDNDDESEVSGLRPDQGAMA